MRKKITALLCAAALSASLLVPQAAAAQSAMESEVLPVLATMGVMNGDAHGNLNLSDQVERAAFVKMAVSASPYKNMAGASSQVSPFADVKYTHWAAGYIKTAVNAGWITGYLDGKFRPANPVTLEEGVSICLKMLGYTNQDFSGGTYPDPQLALYHSLKLDAGITATRGQNLTREQCAQMIYNTLNATTKAGQPYAVTLGYRVDASGNIDYLSVINAELEGPFVMDQASLASCVGFTPTQVYRNDAVSTAEAVQPYDVVYSIKKTKTVWAYHNQVTGVYEAAAPSHSNPTGVVVSGMNYAFETSAAAHAMSATGKFHIGDTVTLLLGRDNTIAGVVDPTASGSATHGIVLATGTGTYMDAQGKPYTAPYLKMLGVDGVTYQYQTEKSGYYKEGDLVKVTFEKGVAKIERLSNTSGNLSGKVNSTATKLGSDTFADNVKIMDYADGAAVTVPADRLANVRIENNQITYYELNGAGEIETLILKDVTGDMYQFGILTKDEEIYGMMGNMPVVTGHMYTVTAGGQEIGPLVCQNTSFPVKQGQVVRYRMDGTELEKMYALKDISLISAEGGSAVGRNNQKFDISRGVQVYERRNVVGEGTRYYLTSLEKVNTGDYTLTGWYDKDESNGGRMRVIVAAAK